MDERRERVLTSSFDTPWGEGMVSVCCGWLAGVELPPLRESQVTVRRPEAGALEKQPFGPAIDRDGLDSDALDHWQGELEAYFRGERLAWRPEELPLDRLPVGTFARDVYATLMLVPPAVTVSYGTLAEMAGYPRAARAVGHAMATNPIPIVIPCHRVIRSDGALGNYGTDPAWKERLLSHEASHRRGTVPG